MTTQPERPFNEVMTEMWTTIAAVQQKAEAGHAIFLASIAAEILRRAIIDRLIPLSKELEEKLFDGYGPLATFSGRIDMAFALGSITTKTQKEMHKIKRIRNEFAHTTEKLDFKAPAIVELCKKLVVFDASTNDAQGDYVRTIQNMIQEIRDREAIATGRPRPLASVPSG